MAVAPTAAPAAAKSGRKECRAAKNNTASNARAINSEIPALHRLTKSSQIADMKPTNKPAVTEQPAAANSDSVQRVVSWLEQDGTPAGYADYLCPQCGPDSNGGRIHQMTHHVWPPMSVEIAVKILNLKPANDGGER